MLEFCVSKNLLKLFIYSFFNSLFKIFSNYQIFNRNIFSQNELNFKSTTNLKLSFYHNQHF